MIFLSLIFFWSFSYASNQLSSTAVLSEQNLRNDMEFIVNFLKEEQSSQTIVKHVSEQDYNKLKSLLPEGVIGKRKIEEALQKLNERRASGYGENGDEINVKADMAFILEENQKMYDEFLKTVRVEVDLFDDFKKMTGRKLIGYEKLKGEWSCNMKTEKDIILIGKKNTEAYDSNSFTPTMIHNNMAEVYLTHSWLKDIPSVLDKAYETSLNYQRNGGFGFWLEQPKLLSILPKVEEQFIEEEVRRPNNFPLSGYYINMRADVANDADDTAISYLTLALNNKVRETDKREMNPVHSWQPQKIGTLFSEYRDLNRKKTYPYNKIYGNNVNTGAFLTWLMQEKFGFLSVVWKLNWDSTGIAGGLNDLDCVVNANVLTTLVTYNELNTPGVEDSCKFLNKVSQSKKEMRTCGIYYPNPYQFHYATAKAYGAGVNCLEPAMENILQDIREGQLADGSWEGGTTKEPIQSTLYALNSLLSGIEKREVSARKSDFLRATQALEYLLTKSIKEKKNGREELFWPAGVFFSGGFGIRNTLIWRSQAYSTSLGLAAISKYLKELGNHQKNHSNKTKKNDFEGCGYYEKYESIKHCGEKGYPLKFGKKYCEKFMEKRNEFSDKGKSWFDKTRICLQEKLASTLDDSTMTCGKVKKLSVSHHAQCYVETGFCDLGEGDKFNILEVMVPELKTFDFYKGYWVSGKLCAEQFEQALNEMDSDLKVELDSKKDDGIFNQHWLEQIYLSKSRRSKILTNDRL